MRRDLRPGGRSRANTRADNVILEVFLDIITFAFAEVLLRECRRNPDRSLIKTIQK